MKIVLFIALLLCASLIAAKKVINAPELTGAELMNRGLDFRQGGLIPEDRVRQRIFNYNYRKGKTYKVPGRNDLTFKVPDETTVTHAATHLEKFNSKIESTYSEQVKTQINGFNFGIKIDAVKYGIGAEYNVEWGRIQHNLRTEFTYTANGLYLTTTYSLLGLPYLFMPLDDMFNQVVDMLPTTPRSQRDLDLYKLSIDYYGGFFMWQAMFGGQVKTYTYFNQKVVESSTTSWLNQQMKLTFHYKLLELSAGGYRNRSEVKIDKKFLENTNSEVYYTGGFRHLQTNKTLEAWDKSIDDSPSLLYGQFRPLSDLISNQPVKKKNYEWVIKHYSETGKMAIPPAAKLVDNTPKVPGYSVIGSGFDPSHMQVRLSVFDHDEANAFSNARTWVNPFYKDIKFSVPSSVYLRENTASLETNFTEVSMTRSHFESTFAKKWTSKGFFTRRTTQVYNYIKRSDLLSQHSINSEKQINWYDLSLSPSVYFNREMRNKHLNPHFKYVLDMLPKTKSAKSDELYQQVIEYWGTHFVLGAKMGGRVEQECYFDKELLESKSINQIMTQSGFSFFGIINSNRYNFKNDTKVEKWFKDHAHIKTKFIGGRVYSEVGKTKSDTKPWDAFVKSIRTDPGVLKYDLVPISTLIDDPQKKQLFEAAVSTYEEKMKKIPDVKSTHMERHPEPTEEKTIDELIAAMSNQ